MEFPQWKSETEKKAFFRGLKEEEKTEALSEIIRRSEKTVFFGGAGVSTESGIPDFRSKDGLYNQRDVNFDRFTPEFLLSTECLHQYPEVFFSFYRQKMNVEGIEPNAAHRKLAELEKEGKLSCVITQNIDGLHQKAGSRTVYEVHGTTLKNYCERCGKKYPADAIFHSTEAVPHCSCGGMIRPAVTLYGEMLPEEAWRGAERAVREADCLIIGGTSLAVYPAAGLADMFHGTYLVVINRDRTTQDARADLVFHGNIGEVMGKISLSQK